MYGHAALDAPSNLHGPRVERESKVRRLARGWRVTNVAVLLEPPALVPVRRRAAQWRSRSG